jgi:phage shock protein C
MKAKFYRDRRSAKLLGVCAGLANLTGVDAIWVRLTAVLATLFGSGLPLILYVVLALIADDEPQAFAD